MIKAVYVVGDSFSFGQELGPPPEDFFKITPYMIEHCYSGIIAKNWNVEYYLNKSLPSGSNDRIHRMIFTDLPLLFSKYRPDEIFVFISMTHASRREVFYNRYNIYFPLMTNHAPDKKDSELYDFWESYVLNFDNLEESVNRFFSQVLSIQSFLKNLGIDYLITQSMSQYQTNFAKRMEKFPTHMLNLIDRKHFPEIESFQQYNARLGLPIGESKHPLEEGHRAWANYLIEYMKKNNLGVL